MDERSDHRGFFVNSGTKDRRILSIHRTWAGQGSVTQNSFAAEDRTDISKKTTMTRIYDPNTAESKIASCRRDLIENRKKRRKGIWNDILYLTVLTRRSFGYRKRFFPV